MVIETRWSRYKRSSPPVQPLKPPARWWSALFDTIWGTALIAAVGIFTATIMPFIKLALFHRLAWHQYQKGDIGAALGVFLFGCLLFDVGIVWGIILVLQGGLRLR